MKLYVWTEGFEDKASGFCFYLGSYQTVLRSISEPRGAGITPGGAGRKAVHPAGLGFKRLLPAEPVRQPMEPSLTPVGAFISLLCSWSIWRQEKGAKIAISHHFYSHPENSV